MRPLKLKTDKKGQFIIIATLLIAIMIISVASIMYGAVTYYRHERWEEYLAIVDAVENNSYRLVEISLANYTQQENQTILKANMGKWQRDLMKTYTGLGVVLSPTLANSTRDIYSLTIQYNEGLAKDWNNKISFSAANATFNLNITSVGFCEYKFVTPVFLKMNITDAVWYAGKGGDPDQIGVRLIIQKEGVIPIIGLQSANFVEFQVGGANKTYTFYRYFDSQTHNAFVYEFRYNSQTHPSSITVVISVIDSRGIKVTGSTTLAVP